MNPLTFGWVIAYKNYENVRNCFLCKYYKTIIIRARDMLFV